MGSVTERRRSVQVFYRETAKQSPSLGKKKRTEAKSGGFLRKTRRMSPVTGMTA